jgi:hypothetical protein
MIAAPLFAADLPWPFDARFFFELMVAALLLANGARSIAPCRIRSNQFYLPVSPTGYGRQRVGWRMGHLERRSGERIADSDGGPPWCYYGALKALESLDVLRELSPMRFGSLLRYRPAPGARRQRREPPVEGQMFEGNPAVSTQ